MSRTINIRSFKSPISLQPIALHHAFTTILVGLLAYAYLYWRPSPQINWLLLSSLLITQAGLSAEENRPVWRKLLYYPCTGLAIGIAVYIASLCASEFFLALALILLLSLSMSYLGWRYRCYFFTSFLMILFALLALYFPGDSSLAQLRFYQIFLASIIVMVVRALVLIIHHRSDFTFARTQFFQKLNKLYQLIFYISAPTSFFSQELEESHFQITWSDSLSALQLLRSTRGQAMLSRGETTSSGSSSAGPSSTYLATLQNILDLSLSLASIRYRLTDFAVMTMSQDEMQTLLTTITAILKQLGRPQTKKPISLDAFKAAIHRFEELYQSMLQTVSKEPLVLLLFIQDLYALKDEFEILAQYPNPGEKV